MKPTLHRSFPHIRKSITTSEIMADVLIACLPMLIGGVYFFGWRALWCVLFSAAVCSLADWIGNRLRGQPGFDGSGTVTGVLLALCLPAGVPFWALGAAGLFAVAVVKQIPGGIGRNIFNPALAGRALLMIAFPGTLTGYTRVDALSQATPLSRLNDGSWLTMLFGFENGSIGETSVLLILVGAVYLYLRGRVRLRVPMTCLWVFALFVWMCGGSSPFTGPVISHVLSGGFLFGIFFFLTDFTSKPTTPVGELLYAGGVGLLTAVLRLWGRYPEGICFAILLMNLAAPLLEYITRRRVYGVDCPPRPAEGPGEAAASEAMPSGRNA